MILAADIGGTKTIAAVFDSSQPHTLWQPMHITRWASREFTLRHLADYSVHLPLPKPITAAGFSLAGPIINEQCHLVNLNQILDFRSVKEHLPLIRPMVFANDLVATAHSLTVLPASSFVSLTDQPLPITLTARGSASSTNRQPSGCFPISVLSLGTGLGQSVLLSEETALSSEGAHSDFAPNTDQQAALWHYLQHIHGHVSYERVLSGPGLSNIYAFLARNHPGEPDPSNPSRPSPPPTLTPPEITAHALAQTNPLCQTALDLFLEILGAQAGNVALQTMSLGGVCLAGGIIPHILPLLQHTTLHQAFQAKGRFRDVLTPIPIAALNNDQAALWGAFRLAYTALHSPTQDCI